MQEWGCRLTRQAGRVGAGEGGGTSETRTAVQPVQVDGRRVGGEGERGEGADDEGGVVAVKLPYSSAGWWTWRRWGWVSGVTMEHRGGVVAVETPRARMRMAVGNSMKRTSPSVPMLQDRRQKLRKLATFSAGSFGACSHLSFLPH